MSRNLYLIITVVIVIIIVAVLVLTMANKPPQPPVIKTLEDASKALENTDPQVRMYSVSRAVEILEGSGKSAQEIIKSPKFNQTIKLLFKAIEDSHIGVRQNAQEPLGSFIGLTKDKENLQKLISLATSKKDPGVRQSAIQAIDYSVGVEGLNVVWDKSIVTALISLLKDPESTIRAKAVNSLGNLRVEEARKDIEKLLKDPDKEVREVAKETLERL